MGIDLHKHSTPHVTLDAKTNWNVTSNETFDNDQN